MSQRLALVLSGLLTVMTLAGVAVGRDLLLPPSPAQAEFDDAAGYVAEDAVVPDAEPLVIEVMLDAGAATATATATAGAAPARPVVDIAAGARGAATATPKAGNWSPFGAPTATPVDR